VSFLWVFSGSSVVVTPKRILANVDLEMSAQKKPEKSGVASGIFYEILPIEKIGQIEVLSDGEKKVEKRAGGKIVVYNNYSEASQRLVKNTRFETGKGLIYRIQDSIVVPGKKVQNGKVVPGSVEAMVVADSSGSEYNIVAADFTIPGFKTNPSKFAGFFARSKTAMTGGFVGMAKFASDAKINEARSRLHSDLESEILTEAKSGFGDSFVFFDKAYKITFEPILDAGSSGLPSDDQKILIKEKAVFEGYLLNKSAISKYLAEHYIEGYDGSAVEVEDLNKISFNFKNTIIKENSTNDDSIIFGLKGNVSIVWLFDIDSFKNDIKGKPKEDLDQILKKYPGIAKANALVRPFWKKNFPENSTKIIVQPGQDFTNSNSYINGTTTNSASISK
jgi:hypothetical protein